MPRVEIVKKGQKVLSVPIEGTSAVMGREATAPIRLDDVLVSRQHARIFAADGQWWVEDLGTKNGTFVNGKKEYRRPLSGGDRIAIGPYVVTFRLAPGERAPASNEVLGTPVVKEKPMLIQPAKFEPGRTKSMGSKTAARLRDEAASLMAPHVMEHGETPEVHTLKKGVTSIGAGETCGIRSEKAGRGESATIEALPDGTFKVKKSGFFSSLKVNGEKASEHVFKHGDTFTVGEVTFTFSAGVK